MTATDLGLRAFTQASVARCAEWHGDHPWSTSDQYAGLNGEVGEFLDAVWDYCDWRDHPTVAAQVAEEAADVVAYMVLLADTAGIDLAAQLGAPPDRDLWIRAAQRSAGTPSTVTNPINVGFRLAVAAGLAGDTVKKLNRHRDGIAAPRDGSVDDLADQLAIHLSAVFRRVLILANACGFDLADAVVAKHNQVSQREGWPHHTISLAPVAA